MLKFVLTLFSVVVPLYLAQREPCDIGTFVSNRDGFPVGDIGPLNTTEAMECLAECEADPPCACQQEISDDGCTVNGFSDCDFQARCCWNRYWSDKDLSTDAGDGSGRTIGQNICDGTRAALGVSEGELRSLTLDLSGKYQHCGDPGVGAGWNNIDNWVNSTVPVVVCCDQVGTWLDCEDPL